MGKYVWEIQLEDAQIYEMIFENIEYCSKENKDLRMD